jgi:hypothetical protein
MLDDANRVRAPEQRQDKNVADSEYLAFNSYLMSRIIPLLFLNNIFSIADMVHSRFKYCDGKVNFRETTL